MNSHQLEDNLLVIRTLMERSAMYQRAVRPILILAGGVGTAAAVAGYFLQPPFVIYWMSIAVVVLAGAFYLSRRQALRDGEKFWSPPAKRVGVAMLPMMVVGLGGTVIVWIPSDCHAITVLFWLMLYGCALHSAGMFAPVRLRVLGWVCTISGLLLLASIRIPIPNIPAHREYEMMGFFFGILHLIFGLIPARAATKE